MKRYYFLPVVVTALMITSCQNQKNEEEKGSAETENSLMKESSLPFGVPDFDKIESEDFKPAIKEGIKEKRKEIEKIAGSDEDPTFKNTFEALEKSGRELNRVMNVFSLLTGANTDDTLRDVREEMSPKLSELNDDIYLNDDLFDRVKTIHDKLDDLDLDDESERLVDYYYKQFKLAGAKLSDDKKEKLKELNKENASLSTTFSDKLLDAGKKSALIVDDKEKLKGLSDSDIKSAAEKAKDHGHDGKYEIPLQNTTQQPDLQKLENRDSREKLFDLSINRAEQGDSTDTRGVIKKLAANRSKKADLLGYDNYAEWNLQDQMAKSPEEVQKLLGQIVPPATDKAREEASALQKVIDKDGKDFELEPWDWNYYSEKLRKSKFDLDEDDLKPYFELDSVLQNGVFYAAHKLYGLSFKEREDIPVYQDNVRVFEVMDEDDNSIGLFYADYFKRDNKRGGAWMSNIVDQSDLLDEKPVIYNVANFHKPSEGDPALLSYDNVVTMFHEFGHALHGFFADQKYPTLSGTSVARDFVEFPSQFNEHWALEDDVLRNYAKHYKTDEVIPDELVKKIKKSSTFNQGYLMTELLAAAQLDMQWHTISADDDADNVDKFEKKALKRTDLNLDNVPPRYRTSYFSHIWGSGYAAGYYAYIWTKMLEDDAFSWFEENGGMTRENGERFRKEILSKGNTEDYNTMFEDFYGSEPDIEPLLKEKGLIEE